VLVKTLLQSVAKSDRRPRGHTLCCALFLLVSISPVVGQTVPHAQQDSPAAIRPFKMHVPDSVLADLHRRLAETKWPDQLPGTGWEYGADIKKVRELAQYWQTQFDWRGQEARINQFDQFTTEIDGQQIYFIHERSPRSEAIPLMLIHGWPGSIVEFLDLIQPLTQPKDRNALAFDVVIPSLPGFGFSGPTTTRGWSPERMAKAFIVLMDRLGYSRYGVQGGDWGSTVARDVAHDAPEHVIGVHVNSLPLDPPSKEAFAQMSGAERNLAHRADDTLVADLARDGIAYFHRASSRESSVFAASDSP
jgi:Epoxide hydrolase N terminus